MRSVIWIGIMGIWLLGTPGCTDNSKDTGDNDAIYPCGNLSDACEQNCTGCTDTSPPDTASTDTITETDITETTTDTTSDTDTAATDTAATDTAETDTADTDTGVQPTPLYVDVRTVDEYAAGHYPDAINIPVSILADNTNALLPKDQWIIVYCASGSRAAQAFTILQNAGFTNVENGGGLNDLLP